MAIIQHLELFSWKDFQDDSQNLSGRGIALP
jgi:hypothetical protein